MHDPVAIEPATDQTAWGEVAPDLLGCFSAGDTMADARRQGEQAEPAVKAGIEATRDAGASRSGFIARRAIEGRTTVAQA